MRVLVVDDSAFMRRAVSQMLTSDPKIQVVGVGKNGKEGLALAKRLKPDLITMDIEMPEMDGLSALRRIMKECPTQVLMLSSMTTDGSHSALQALKMGAADVLAKDLQFGTQNQELLTRVRALGQASCNRRSPEYVPNQPYSKLPVFRSDQFDVICIGSSTGGPPVLEQVLTSLPKTFGTPVVIAQHMPAVFTKSMAERLDERCHLRVIQAQDQMPLERGMVYVAPGGKHTHSHWPHSRTLGLLVNEEPVDAVYKPGVDALLRSAAAHCASRTLAIVMTGIGSDGLEGGRELHARGGIIIAQNEASCVVYGMPKAVIENKIAIASLAPIRIAEALNALAPSEADAA